MTDTGITQDTGPDTVAVAFPHGVEIHTALKRLAETRTKSAAEKLRRRATENIKDYSKYLLEASERLSNAAELAKKDVDQWVEALARLKEAGFKTETNDYDMEIVVRIKESRLPDVARAIGLLNKDSANKYLKDGEKKLVTVHVWSVKYPNVKVIYVHKLKATDRCRIEVIEVPAKVEHKLICEV